MSRTFATVIVAVLLAYLPSTAWAHKRVRPHSHHPHPDSTQCCNGHPSPYPVGYLVDPACWRWDPLMRWTWVCN